jgi:pimeloyl-ACP methyl ester carboxylesterase
MAQALPYREFKNGKTCLVFLHGLMEDARMWTDLLSDLPFYSVAIDLPGYGQAQDQTFDSIADAAESVELTLQKIEINSCVVIGHSMGGYVALSYLEKYPEKLLGVGLLHSHPFADSEEKKQERNKSIAFIEKFGLEIYAQQFIPSLFARSYKDNLAIHTLSLRATQQSQAGVIQSMRAMQQRTDRSSVVLSSDTPMLWVLGTEDHLVDLHRTLDVAAKSDQSMIEVYEKVGHMSMFEHSNVLYKTLIKFVRYCEQISRA